MEESLAALTLKSDESNVLMLMVIEAVVMEVRVFDAMGSREAVCWLRQREIVTTSKQDMNLNLAFRKQQQKCYRTNDVLRKIFEVCVLP